MRRILVFVWLAVITSLAAAPAPKPKVIPEHPRRLSGYWVMTWGSSSGMVTLGEDGVYYCHSGEHQWIATWKADRQFITLTEHTLYQDGTKSDYAQVYPLAIARDQKSAAAGIVRIKR